MASPKLVPNYRCTWRIVAKCLLGALRGAARSASKGVVAQFVTRFELRQNKITQVGCACKFYLMSLLSGCALHQFQLKAKHFGNGFQV